MSTSKSTRRRSPAFKIRFDNRTDWPTGEIRKLFLACAKHEGMDYPGTYYVRLYYPRGGGGGYGYYNYRSMKLSLPNWNGFPEDKDRATETCAINLARVIIHEMGHNRGLKHKDMCSKAEAAAAREVCDKLGMTVIRRDTPGKLAKAAAPAPSKLEQAKAKVDRVFELMEAEVKRHATNMKRLRTRRRKALASLRYYQQKD